MENESENKNIIPETDKAQAESAPQSETAGEGDAQKTECVPAPILGKQKKRLPLIKSMTVRTTLDYCLFSLILLILFFAVFLSGLNTFYGRMMEEEVKRIERSASAGFPKKVDDNSFIMLYKNRLLDVARGNKPIAIAVFEVDENGKNDICIMVDDMGNGISDDSDLFDAVMDKLDFKSVFSSGKQCKVDTPFGTYLCKGSPHATEDGGTAYLLVMKPYDVWNQQTVKIIYVLALCTIIVLVLAFVFAFFASRHQTKHLTDFSQKAKRLAEGDYNVVFSGAGFNEYENLACALNAATQNIQKAEQLQRDIVANVSHDIRTPLTMIRAYAEMLRDMPMDEKKREKTAGVIIAEADRLTALVGDVLNYSKLQSGVTEYKFDSTDLSEIAAAVLERFDVVRERDGIKLLHDIDSDAVATCDKPKIEQVLYNLIGNAVNYCGDDKTIILRVKKQDGGVRVEVTDHGSGIEQSELDSVWDRYYRSAHSTRTAVGSGLGLSICKSILTAHNAEFGIISKIGKGSTFWFELK
ncbi:MAG: HAMP domain-containing histidine kinase [Clostridiales bacterium]|nr:HAMP domain-containing histidine kinase [Clostridiales bacterium]